MTGYLPPGPDRMTLFQTTAWQQAWQNSWLPTLQTPQFKLYPAAGAYQVRHVLKGLLRVSSLVPFGCHAPLVGSMRSEYWHHVAPIEKQTPSVEGWLQRALPYIKDQLLLRDVALDSAAFQAIARFATAHNLALLQRDESIAYAVDSEHQSFANYLSILGANTRLKLFNRRKRFAQLGAIRVVNMWPDTRAFIEQINVFHLARWGRPCFSGTNRNFVEQLMTQLVADGHRVDLSALMLDEEIVSVLLDLTVEQRTYNLQGGFLEDRFKGISLGTLHFGYQIEKACVDQGVQVYDFMAGAGKHSNYKVKLGTMSTKLVDLALVKSPWLAVFYRLNEQKNRLLKC
ncbi:GNAT family N-acetyltransferase [Reinekea sp.]|jgi:CelD/BcsL family acetyltransferase involved in cellulose biosynthesis|uniref:GNAT family N-acetyltransferase n=1 Tax=Reinekea sp. TaxID=1970455 RepID=UPI002A83F9D2|nr:GNAT family N-acetyltransferase [Reinekea sp.]